MYLYDCYIPDISGNKLSIVQNDTVIKNDIPTGQKPTGVCVDTNQLSIWVTNAVTSTTMYQNGVKVNVADRTTRAKGSVSRYDTTTKKRMDDIIVGNTPMGIAQGPDRALYVANYGSNSVSKIVDNKVVKTITSGIGVGPRGIAVDKNGIVYVANYLSNTVSIISNDIVVKTVDVAWNPCGIAILKNGTVFVACAGSNVVCKIEDMKKTADINVGKTPYGVCADLSGNIWVTNYASDTITRIGGNDVEHIGVGDGPYGIATNKDGAVYVACQLEGKLYKLVNKVTTEVISVPINPVAFGDFTGLQAYYLFKYQSGGSGSGASGPVSESDLDPSLREKIEQGIELPINARDVNNTNPNTVTEFPTVQDALDALLTQSLVKIKSFTADRTVFEKGENAGIVTFEWEIEGEPANINLNVFGDLTPTVRSKTVDTSFTFNSKAILTVTDKVGNTVKAELPFTFVDAIYYGASDEEEGNELMLSLFEQVLGEKLGLNDVTIDCSDPMYTEQEDEDDPDELEPDDGGKYFYIIVPAGTDWHDHIFVNGMLCDAFEESTFTSDLEMQSNTYLALRSTYKTHGSVRVDYR